MMVMMMMMMMNDDNVIVVVVDYDDVIVVVVVVVVDDDDDVSMRCNDDDDDDDDDDVCKCKTSDNEFLVKLFTFHLFNLLHTLSYIYIFLNDYRCKSHNICRHGTKLYTNIYK